MMKGIVIDDELLARTVLKELAAQLPDVTIVADFPNAMSAIKYLNSNDVDFIFLDIHMPDFDGFDFLESLKKTPKVVLTTSDDQQALKAFKYKFVVDYILKPLELDRFKDSIDKLKSFMIVKERNDEVKEEKKNVYQDFLFVNVDKRLIKITFSDILIIQASRNYILLKTANQTYKVHSPLKKILTKLPPQDFLRIHKSFIVNLNSVVDIEDNSILIGKEVIPVGKTYRAKLKKRLNLL
ncbi:LytTR family DNA-binding domain-containing protein [Polaribacter tangerinus]|uniref:LytR/AlgR family response regulator transcription factor n=1 Tax=Polaribacter tangerinus TaxID=1920034 RepID=UPI0029370406|nr:LytTR family DNA-binding domain-containing protein [Polaribacter tangerinus]